jgi:G3E family GTPase
MSNSYNESIRRIPITILSGFLGSGKTTLLQNMLQNKQGLKIGVVVNDVASVNIDSKLVARDSSASFLGGKDTGSTGSDGMVELQNGCACCSLSDELLTSISELVTLSDMRAEDDQFHHIVVELSGVADPKQVRAKFQEAVMEQMPLMERVQLDTLVSLVDCSTFQSHFESTKTASRKETPELFFRDGDAALEEQEEEWMKDLPPKLLEAVMAGMNAAQASQDEQNGVADLLVSQTETADLVILNKIDLLADDDELARLKEIVAALNPRAKSLTTSFGSVAITDVLGVAKGDGVALAGAVDDHRDYVTAAAAVGGSSKVDKTMEVEEACTDADCTEDSHSHSHAHSSHGATDAAEDCTDPSHDHSHSHKDHAAAACAEPECTDPSHSHSHDDHAPSSASSSCEDPDCEDASHSHSHSHAAVEGHAGIGTFVYTARRPFHPGRMGSFLRHLPVVRGIPEGAASTDNNQVMVSAEAQETLSKCLRSKGFVWCADSHKSAMYWSHAGSSFELSCLGQWWATLPRDQWPADVDEYVLQDFDNDQHDDATNPVGVGDRRQELVFIGPNFGGAAAQAQVQEILSKCLLNDAEYEEYQSIQVDESKLETRFSNAIESKYVQY